MEMDVDVAGRAEPKMDMGMEMDVDVTAKGRKRYAGEEGAPEPDKDFRWEEGLRGKLNKWNCFEVPEGLSPEVKELLREGHRLKIRNGANRVRSAKFREEIARLFPKSGIPL